MATAAEIARLRELIGADPRPDAELGALIDATPPCVAADETTTADLHGTAADIWEARAMAQAADAESEAVTAKKSGDASVTYAEGGRAKSLLAIAARHRRRSCNRPAATRTVDIAPPASADRARLDILDVNDAYDRNVMVNAPASRD